ncbi:MAG: methylated-DNA--[protein]-cysteine S-methyltransferase [Thermoplasmatales archaeon]|jgi:methylated-DNA-[protein]-cysteine S-methyltransferase|nr:methylated-DNA--[protein]-cysteine S-methyltransferase [Thermoplasmatales archaeon]
MSISYFPTTFGNLGIEDDGEYVTRIFLGPGESEPTDVALRAFEEISEYLSGDRREFTFGIRTEGTDFQKRVWDAISEIPYGETRTYAQIADRAGRPRAVRAAGSACGMNPVAIAIPCHRVVRTNGETGNYFYGTEMKESLLRMERDH